MDLDHAFFKYYLPIKFLKRLQYVFSFYKITFIYMVYLDTNIHYMIFNFFNSRSSKLFNNKIQNSCEI